jgi:hypothetical protein
MITATAIEVAWLAGILEGEGSFMMIRNRPGGGITRYKYPVVTVNMTDRDVIERVANLFGCKTHKISMPKPPPVRKQAWRAIITGSGAADWMRVLLPHMGERRSARIREVLQEWDARTPTHVRRRAACQKAAAKRSRGLDGTFLREEGTE